MALIVQKYGGTSVGSPERIKNVARRVARWHGQGHQVVVVVSAMSGETNRLIALAKEVQAQPDPRELDVMVSTGEQVTIALLSMALMDIGLKARSYTGGQVKILTDSAYTKARIVKIDERKQSARIAIGMIMRIPSQFVVMPVRRAPRICSQASNGLSAYPMLILRPIHQQAYSDRWP